MLISTKELREFLLRKIPNNPIGDFSTGEASAYTNILKELAAWEARLITENPDLPFAFGVDAENALLIYCTPKLYQTVEKMEGAEENDSFGIVELGKIWLEVRKFLKEGRFKRK